jgi:hypothetical protein
MGYFVGFADKKHSFKSFCKSLNVKPVDKWFHYVLSNMNKKYRVLDGENVFYNDNAEWLFQLLDDDTIIYSSNRIGFELGFKSYHMSSTEKDNYVRASLSNWFGKEFKSADERLFSTPNIEKTKEFMRIKYDFD